MYLPPRFKTVLVALAALSLVSLGGASGQALAASSVRSHAATVPHLNLVHPGYLTICTDATYPPMESVRPSGRGYVGADIDLANAIARAMGLRRGAWVVNNIFDTIIDALRVRHRCDAIMTSMNDTAARRKVISFIDYARVAEAIVVRKSSKIRGNSYKAVCGVKVAVEAGTLEQSDLKAACGSRAKIIAPAKDTDAFNTFFAGHADAYSSDLPVADYYVGVHKNLRLAGKPFHGGIYGIGVQKNAKALRSAIQKGLNTIRRNGQYKKILHRWGIDNMAL